MLCVSPVASKLLLLNHGLISNTYCIESAWLISAEKSPATYQNIYHCNYMTRVNYRTRIYMLWNNNKQTSVLSAS